MNYLGQQTNSASSRSATDRMDNLNGVPMRILFNPTPMGGVEYPAAGVHSPPVAGRTLPDMPVPTRVKVPSQCETSLIGLVTSHCHRVEEYFATKCEDAVEAASDAASSASSAATVPACLDTDANIKSLLETCKSPDRRLWCRMNKATSLVEVASGSMKCTAYSFRFVRFFDSARNGSASGTQGGNGTGTQSEGPGNDSSCSELVRCVEESHLVGGEALPGCLQRGPVQATPSPSVVIDGSLVQSLRDLGQPPPAPSGGVAGSGTTGTTPTPIPIPWLYNQARRL